MVGNKRIFLLVVLGLITGFAQSPARSQKASTKVIKVVFEMSAAISMPPQQGGRVVDLQVFRYDPREGIRAALTKAGFKLAPPESDNYELALTIAHRERLAGQRAQTTIDHFGFELQDRSGTTLLKDDRGPYSPSLDLEAVKQVLIEDLVELVQLRMKSADMTSCWIEYVARKGDRASANAIRMASDLTYPDREKQHLVLKPLLRSHSLQSRMFTVRLLQALKYAPADDVEKAVLLIVLSYPYSRWSGNEGSSPGEWAARQGSIPVIQYGTIAVDVFVEDLKGSQDLLMHIYGVDHGGVANRAKAVLMRLSKERWAQFLLGKYIETREVALAGDSKARQLLAAVKRVPIPSLMESEGMGL